MNLIWFYMIWGLFFLVIFGCFWIMFNIFEPGISIFIFETSILLKREFLEARSWTPNSNFWFSFSRTSGQNFERSAGISNVQPEFRTFGRNLELSAGTSKVRPESRTFGRNLESSTGISNVRPESRTFEPAHTHALSKIILWVRWRWWSWWLWRWQSWRRWWWRCRLWRCSWWFPRWWWRR